MSLSRTTSIRQRIEAIENSLASMTVFLEAFDLYLRAVETHLLNKNIVTKEELDAVRKDVIEKHIMSRKPPSKIVKV